ncbi:MAG: YihY/virulence factor BrkB family protein [Verrucomicrobia bacterium]|nr:YihY/virulence factor BrkB family protein [Cytophagales bacterium]
MKDRLKQAWQLLADTYKAFSDDNAFKLSASLSYYTLFSLSPMLVVIIGLCSVFFGREAIQGKVYGQINDLIGNQAAVQVQEMIKNAEFSGQTPWAIAIGIGTLLLGATGLFTEMQDSLNTIWQVKAKPRRGWLKLLINRALSFSVIVSIGFLLLVSLLVSALLNIFSKKLEILLADATYVLFFVINILVILAVITTLFALIFKVLPDVLIRWKDAWIGAGFTALLFMLGRYLIGLYLGQTGAGTAYGAAGSIVVILLWVYYSSTILYFGAEFTKVYAQRFGEGIHPDSDAVRIEIKEIQKTV